MKLRIVSDGSPMGTSVVHSETGEPVEGVTSIAIMITPTRMVTTITTVAEATVDVDVEHGKDGSYRGQYGHDHR